VSSDSDRRSAAAPSFEARDSGEDPEAEYYQSIEEHFVSRRGDPLFLSNADWFLIRDWRQAGLPLRVVLRGISDALDAHEHSWSRTRKVGSLRYCAAEVEAAADRWRRALAGGHDETQLGVALEALASALTNASGLGPQAQCVALDVARELRLEATMAEAGEALETRLRLSEARLVAAIDADATEDERRAIEAEVERDLAAYRDRLPPRVLEQVRDESMVRRKLEQFGLARMSLWSL
jgi:hypothetical protein